MKKSEIPEFIWSKECQEGFDKLKEALTTAPILAYPDYSKPFLLETDASLRGLGAVLSQKSDDNMVRVIAYASRSLRLGEKSMRDYLSAKIELLALKWSVCEKFKDYLLGSKFTVYTDNNPLVYVKTSKLVMAQIHWLSELALYDFNIVYRTGKGTWLLMPYHGDQSRIIRLTRKEVKTVTRNGKQYHTQLRPRVVILMTMSVFLTKFFLMKLHLSWEVRNLT